MAKAHELGARRHLGGWLSANEAALSVLRDYLPPEDPVVGEMLSVILLRVLDSQMVASGYDWSGHKWVKRPRPAKPAHNPQPSTLNPQPL